MKTVKRTVKEKGPNGKLVETGTTFEIRVAENFADLQAWPQDFVVSIFNKGNDLHERAKLKGDGGKVASRDAVNNWLISHHFDWWKANIQPYLLKDRKLVNDQLDAVGEKCESSIALDEPHDGELI